MLTFFWFSVFGGAAFHLQLKGGTDLAQVATQNIPTALFQLFAHYPFSLALTLIAILLLGVFFVTSADSATFVLSMMTSNGKLTPPAAKKIIWGLTVSITASLLLHVGGLEALQKMAIAAALPFTIVMLALCRSLVKGLKYEAKERQED
jgi:glycine betaine transporter